MKMEATKGAVLDTFPLKDAIWVDDLIIYNIPMLSRYKFQSRDYLYYHVDDDNDLDTYLIFTISETELYDYISGNVSLRTTILNVKEPIYLIDLDYDEEVTKTVLLFSNQIIDDYLPDADSFLELKWEEDSYYSNLISKYKSDQHTEKLKQKAFYIKFSSSSHKHGSNMALDEVFNDKMPVFTAIYKNYTFADFENRFNSVITDENKLKRAYNDLSDEIQYRIVDTKVASFEIGLAADPSIYYTSGNNQFVDWAREVGENFKEDVLEIDLDNKEDLQKIASKFNEEQRAKIYKPFANLVNDNKVNFLYKRNGKARYHRVKKLGASFEKSLFPAKPEIITLQTQPQLLTVTALVQPGTKSITLANALTLPFAEETISLTNELFQQFSQSIIVENPIPVEFSSQNGKNYLTAEFLSTKFTVLVDGNNIQSAVEKLVKEISESVDKNDDPVF